MTKGPTPTQSSPCKTNKMSGIVGSSSPRVQLTMKRLKSMEAGHYNKREEVQPTTTKLAQKLTNFRANLHKSSVAGCFVELLDMTNEGIMTKSGLYPSSRYKQYRDRRKAGLRGSSRSRPLTRTSGLNKIQAPLGFLSPHHNEDLRQQQQQRGRLRRRPSTALETPTTALPTEPPPDAPLTARAGFSGQDCFTAAGARVLTVASSCSSSSCDGIGTNMATTLNIKRTQWVEGDVQQGVGGRLEVGTAGQSQQKLQLAVVPETNSGGEGARAESCHDYSRRRNSTRAASSVGSPSPRLAWGNATREMTSSGTIVTNMKAVELKARAKGAEERRKRVVCVRAGLIEGEKLRAQAFLCQNDGRKKLAAEAAALIASQRGLLEAITLVLASKRLWAGWLKRAQQRDLEHQLGRAATVVQRAYKAYTGRRIFKMLLAVRRVHLRLYLGIRIRQKIMSRTKIVWFLTGCGGGKARPRMVIRAFMFHIRRCQRAAREWLACRAATIEAVCLLWDRIEAEIRRALRNELNRAKRAWMKNALRTGEDTHTHGQWRKLKAKTRILVARIDHLEAQIERQQNLDTKARVLAARSMLKPRISLGSGAATGSQRNVAQVDYAEKRTSTVPSAKRLAIIRSSLSAKFSLHKQGGKRDERTGNRVIGAMDARMVIRGEFPNAPPDESGEGAAATTAAGAPAVVRFAKRSRALIYTGDLGRSWQQIVEDTVMQDFRRNAFARRDCMPYLQYSAVLSLDMYDASGSAEGPSAAAFAAAAGEGEAAGGKSGPAVTTANDGRASGGGFATGNALKHRRRQRHEGLTGEGEQERPVVCLTPFSEIPPPFIVF